MPKTYFGLEKIPKLAFKLQRFQNFKFLKKKNPQPKKSKNVPGAVEISADPKILEIVKFGPRKSSKTPGHIFSSLFHFLWTFEANFTQNFESF